MEKIAFKLCLKYGLTNEPSEYLVQQWFTKTISYINNGYDSEMAGRKAAQEVFSDYKTYCRKSQADDILTLLNMIKGNR